MQRTQVAIIGGGPAGLLLARALHRAKIDFVLLEKKSRAYVLSRIRAGLLEQGTVDTLIEFGCGERLLRERMLHDGTVLSFNGDSLRIDFAERVGKRVTIYGQTEVTRDLMDAHVAAGTACHYEADVTRIDGLDGDRARVTYVADGREHVLEADWVAGCDGFHGVARATLPSTVIKTYERVYPFGWLGILADVPPCHHELIYANHADGFALATMRSETRTRAYIQVPASEDVRNWSDDRFWAEYIKRLGPEVGRTVQTGPSIEKSIAPLRSFVAEPMRYGRLFLAGDAAHIVPPTGAKGLNLAVADVRRLADALTRFYATGATDRLDTYAEKSLARVWKAVRFSWSLTRLLHQFPAEDAFDRAIQKAEFDYLKSSTVAQTALAENYVGLPLDV
jgi:p-hydroxybenzoate 3-monooxygenase